mmetsp:Transcript_24991/g.41918  ORF Transcript_24991/g.41918 Transcript_24991/m.41918 type:complete len:293 (+) Transcript_24991:213-1091(+)
MMRKAVVLELIGEGFDGARGQAVDVLTDLAVDYVESFGNELQKLMGKYYIEQAIHAYGLTAKRKKSREAAVHANVIADWEPKLVRTSATATAPTTHRHVIVSTTNNTNNRNTSTATTTTRHSAKGGRHHSSSSSLTKTTTTRAVVRHSSSSSSSSGRYISGKAKDVVVSRSSGSSSSSYTSSSYYHSRASSSSSRRRNYMSSPHLEESGVTNIPLSLKDLPMVSEMSTNTATIGKAAMQSALHTVALAYDDVQDSLLPICFAKMGVPPSTLLDHVHLERLRAATNDRRRFPK